MGGDSFFFGGCLHQSASSSNCAAVLALGWIGYDATIAAAGGVQAASVLTGIKVLCVLVPGIFVLGSWAAFKYVWNITPEIKAEMAAAKAAKKAE